MKRARQTCVASVIGLTLLGLGQSNAGGKRPLNVDWSNYGGDSEETHYSPLMDITPASIRRLGLTAATELNATSDASTPLAVDGIVYVAIGLSIVQAIDAETGRTLWRYDPEVAKLAGRKLRFGWGIRGLTYRNGRLFVGTQDGRLIAIDAKTGKPVWIANTTGTSPDLYITGAPRMIGDKVIIGNAGADFASVRGYVTAYDAATGRQAWRFYTVPGNPALGFEDATQAMAAMTWSGEWWKYGGGGTAWSGLTYDPELKRVYIGVGNGGPWNWKIRNPQGKDNLFLTSIVALDAETGKYIWHYQENPNEAWDYSAAMDMTLTTLTIDGAPRKVLMQAPKNGFFYVIDRLTGKLISAEKLVKATWASSIDLKTGRPNEAPDIRYENGSSTLWPSFFGGHNWQPMAFSKLTRLVYLTTLDMGATWSDKGIDEKTWRATPGVNNAAIVPGMAPDGDIIKGNLVAWDPTNQKAAWKVETPGGWNPGPLATAGGLVFQGDIAGYFNAYAAATGQKLWSFPTGVAVSGAPISFSHRGRQFVAVLTGPPTGSEATFAARAGITWDFRRHPRRLLIFALDGQRKLPATPPLVPIQPIEDTGRADPALAAQGLPLYVARCVICHGSGARSGGAAPDLRASIIPTSITAFRSVVIEGAIESQGMPKFAEMNSADAEAVRAYIRSRAEQDLAHPATSIKIDSAN